MKGRAKRKTMIKTNFVWVGDHINLRKVHVIIATKKTILQNLAQNLLKAKFGLNNLYVVN